MPGVASIKFDNPLNWIGPNLSSSQLLVPTNATPGIGESIPLSGAQLASLNGRVDSLAASLHASVVPLESAGSLYQTGTPRHSPQNFSGNVDVATPQLLAAYRIKASQIAPGTDFLTMRPGLAGSAAHADRLWHDGMVNDDSNPATPGSDGGPSCTPGNDCAASPAIQTVSSLPGGTYAPNTLITESPVRKYHMQPQRPVALQAPAPLPPRSSTPHGSSRSRTRYGRAAT